MKEVQVAATARELLAALLAAQDESSSSVQLAAKPISDVRVEVQGLGKLTLPVPADQARRLRELGRRAPYGRGEQTITDPAVRDTWEVPRELVDVEWAGGSGLGPDLDVVRDELGLPEHCRLTAELHSLLVYEEGQFFLPHQDSEKHDSMVATLVVMLPSGHTGGELVVHHLGESTIYRGSSGRVALVAFYADCRHEVRPVTSGHRVVLTYDLLLHGDPVDRVPDDDTIARAAQHLREHFTTGVTHRYRGTPSQPPHRLAFLLDHEYTEHGLGWARLKGTDSYRSALLRAAADAADCQAVLALTEIKETWDAYDQDSDDDYHRSSRWDDDYDEDDDEAAGRQARYEVNSLIDSSIRLTRWTDSSGASAEDVSLDVADEEVCTATPSSLLTPYSQEYEGYMGNWGNTLDRWYRRAAVLVWPRDRGFANRAEASPTWAMGELCTLASTEGAAAAREVAATLTPFWSTAVRSQERPGPQLPGQARPGQLLLKALSAAAALDDEDAASTLLAPFAVEDLRARHMPQLADLCGRYGERWTADLLRTWFGTRSGWSYHGLSKPRWMATLPALCDALQAAGDPESTAARTLLTRSWESLAASIDTGAASGSASGRRQQLADLGEPLAAIMRATASLPPSSLLAADLRDRIVAHCRAHGDAAYDCVLPALRTAATFPEQTGRDAGFRQLAADQASVLRARLAQPVRAEDDWSIQLPGGCDCTLCAALRAFLTDPARRTFEWPLAKAGRSHVHSRIDRAELPVTHQTRRLGSPYTLVLTKTTLLFTGEKKLRHQAQTDLDWLTSHWLTTP